MTRAASNATLATATSPGSKRRASRRSCCIDYFVFQGATICVVISTAGVVNVVLEELTVFFPRWRVRSGVNLNVIAGLVV